MHDLVATVFRCALMVAFGALLHWHFLDVIVALKHASGSSVVLRCVCPPNKFVTHLSTQVKPVRCARA